MNIIDSIRKFFIRISYRRANKGWGDDGPMNYANLKLALVELRDRVLNDTLEQREYGVCFNAGFMGYAKEFKTESRLFLNMAERFNRKVRKVNSPEISFAYPFRDVDLLEPGNDLWTGESGAVRIKCIQWIIEQIEKYELDGGLQPDVLEWRRVAKEYADAW